MWVLRDFLITSYILVGQQHKALPSELILPALRRFTVLHTPLFSKGDANALSTWIRRISSASSLETLQTIPSDASGPSLCFDGLISHIASKHHRTLLTLQMPKAYARVSALRTLLRKCTHLQNFSLSVSFSTLVSHSALSHRVRFNVLSLSINRRHSPSWRMIAQN